MKTYLILIAIALVLFGLISKFIDFMRDLRIKKGFSNKIKITINDNETLVQDQEGRAVCNEPNLVLVTKRNKALGFGSVEALKKPNKNIQEINFIRNLDQVERAMGDFWYQYVTYYVLKYKRENKISSFTTISASINIDVSSKDTKEKVRLGVESAKNINRPRFYNILDIS